MDEDVKIKKKSQLCWWVLGVLVWYKSEKDLFASRPILSKRTRPVYIFFSPDNPILSFNEKVHDILKKDVHVNQTSFKEGDMVYIKNIAPTKLQPKYDGPYKILEVLPNRNACKIMSQGQVQLIHYKRLKKPFWHKKKRKNEVYVTMWPQKFIFYCSIVLLFSIVIILVYIRTIVSNIPF